VHESGARFEPVSIGDFAIGYEHCAAPSEIWLELPAVTTPSPLGRKTVAAKPSWPDQSCRAPFIPGERDMPAFGIQPRCRNDLSMVSGFDRGARAGMALG